MRGARQRRFLDKLQEQVGKSQKSLLFFNEHPKPETFASEPFFFEVFRLDTSLNVPLWEKVNNLMSTKLYVGNLSFDTTSQDLETMFAESGTVTSANIIEDRETGRSRGFAFVEMSSPEEAKAAISAFDGKEVGGRNLKVNEAKAREERGGGRNGGGRGRGGNYGGGSRW